MLHKAGLTRTVVVFKVSRHGVASGSLTAGWRVCHIRVMLVRRRPGSPSEPCVATMLLSFCSRNRLRIMRLVERMLGASAPREMVDVCVFSENHSFCKLVTEPPIQLSRTRFLTTQYRLFVMLDWMSECIDNPYSAMYCDIWSTFWMKQLSRYRHFLNPLVRWECFTKQASQELSSFSRWVAMESPLARSPLYSVSKYDGGSISKYDGESMHTGQGQIDTPQEQYTMSQATLLNFKRLAVWVGRAHSFNGRRMLTLFNKRWYNLQATMLNDCNISRVLNM